MRDRGRHQHGCQRQTVTSQPLLQQLACLRQPARHRSRLPPQLLCRLGHALAFEVAKHKGRLELCRQALDLGAQRRLDVAPGFFRHALSSLCHGACLSIPGLPPGRVAAGAQRDAVSNAVQPARQGIVLANGTRLASENDERRLEGILGILTAGQRAPADIPDHPLMPAQQFREGVLATIVQVEVQKLPIAQTPGFLGVDQVRDVLQDIVQSACDHVGIPCCPRACQRSLVIVPAARSMLWLSGRNGREVMPLDWAGSRNRRHPCL